MVNPHWSAFLLVSQWVWLIHHLTSVLPPKLLPTLPMIAYHLTMFLIIIWRALLPHQAMPLLAPLPLMSPLVLALPAAPAAVPLAPILLALPTPTSSISHDISSVLTTELCQCLHGQLPGPLPRELMPPTHGPLNPPSCH